MEYEYVTYFFVVNSEVVKMCKRKKFSDITISDVKDDLIKYHKIKENQIIKIVKLDPIFIKKALQFRIILNSFQGMVIFNISFIKLIN